MLHDTVAVPGPIQIGEAAKLTTLSIDTIRLYERRALLPKMPRTAGRFRLYTADDVSRLSFIKQMQGVGFSLQEIKKLLELRERPRRCELQDGATAFPHLTRVFAGGLRSRRSIEAGKVGQADSPSSLGTDPGIGLEPTYAPGLGSHLRPASYPVLGQGSFGRETTGSADF
jgi:DNA-binding transcriptional MerR regulator